MAGKFIEEIGHRYGRLIVVERVKNIRGNAAYRCLCDCGGEIIATGGNLRSGNVKSCGCLLIEHAKGNGKNFLKHGRSKTRLHRIWRKMRARCQNKNDDSYFKYGARGINVCDEWQDFMSFAKWSEENGYNEFLSIDRIDNDGNYCPTNCRWTTPLVQGNNTRRNVFLEYKGQRKTMTEWCRCLNVPLSRVKERLKKGWSVEDALERPPLKKRVHKNGV